MNKSAHIRKKDGGSVDVTGHSARSLEAKGHLSLDPFICLVGIGHDGQRQEIYMDPVTARELVFDLADAIVRAEGAR